MHFSWSKTPFPGQSECFVAVLLTLFDSNRIDGSFYLNGCSLMFLCMYLCFFIKVKNMFFTFFICKLMFLTSMHKIIMSSRGELIHWRSQQFVLRGLRTEAASSRRRRRWRERGVGRGYFPLSPQPTRTSEGDFFPLQAAERSWSAQLCAELAKDYKGLRFLIIDKPDKSVSAWQYSAGNCWYMEANWLHVESLMSPDMSQRPVRWPFDI